MERGCKAELQTCSMDESCQSGSLYGISIRSSSRSLSDLQYRSMTLAVKDEKQMCLAGCPEIWCKINELGELWEVEIDLIEESYIQGTELRCVDEGHEVL